MKDFIKKWWSKFKTWFISGEEQAKKITEVAISVTNVVKTITDSPLDDILAEVAKATIPGSSVIIDKIMSEIPVVLPKVISELSIVDGLLTEGTVEQKAEYVLSKIKFASDEQKNLFAHNLCTALVQAFSDGKFTFGEAVVLSEMVYQELKQNKQ